MKTPLGRVRGLGSARTGTRQFWRQRLSSIALLPLAVVLVGILVAANGADHASVVDLLGHPLVAVSLILAIAITGYHMRVGMQEVIDDYIHAPLPKFLATIGNLGFTLAVAAAGIFALLKISLGT